ELASDGPQGQPAADGGDHVPTTLGSGVFFVIAFSPEGAVSVNHSSGVTGMYCHSTDRDVLSLAPLKDKMKGMFTTSKDLSAQATVLVVEKEDTKAVQVQFMSPSCQRRWPTLSLGLASCQQSPILGKLRGWKQIPTSDAGWSMAMVGCVLGRREG